MPEEKFPDLPEPAPLPADRSGMWTYLKWTGGLFAFVLSLWFVISKGCFGPLPGIPERERPAIPAGVDQEKDLEVRENGLWYRIGETEPYTGAAFKYYPDGKPMSRTLLKDGVGYGLIEEWDDNGSIKGTRFREEIDQ